jgi:tripartite-type tricarboxylate transporter receptor subunit TctC
MNRARAGATPDRFSTQETPVKPTLPHLLLAFALALLAPLAHAQWSPTKPVRIIIPFPAGGIVELMARTVTDRLSASLGQPVIVEARTGAGGSIGTEAAARAEPDGHTLVIATLSHVTLPAFGGKLPWHPTRDFAGIGMLGQVANLAVLTPGLEPRTLRDFVAYAKARPGQINYVNAGNGTSQTLGVEMLRKDTGIQLTPVGYKGYPPVVPDLVAGRIEFALMPFGVAAPHVKAGKMRALAVVAPARNPQFPDLPTLAEAGFPEAPVISWYAFLAPAGTPRPALQRLATELARALADPEVVARIETVGGSPLPPGTPTEVDAMVARETERWARFVRESGLTLQ